MAHDKYKMTPDDLQELRDHAHEVGLRDAHLGKFLQRLIPHVAHAHGLDPAEEDEKKRDAQDKAAKRAQQQFDQAVGSSEEDRNAPSTPAQEESQRIAKMEHRPYAAGHDEQLDPVARETQEKGIDTVPTLQALEALTQQDAPNQEDPATSSIADLSSAETSDRTPEEQAKKSRKHAKEEK